MNARSAVLFTLALAIGAGIAAFQRSPGYMDADYYLMGGERLAGGEGFTEQVLWNYLDSPTGLPHPSHSYWMPGPSLLAAAALVFAPEGGFAAARWAFVFVSALVPPLTAALAHRLSAGLPRHRRERAAWLAGLLALPSGYYLGFLTTTDSFGIVMALGGLFFFILAGETHSWRLSLALGALAGLLHLSRADGLLWLPVAAAAVVTRRKFWQPAAAVLSGYLAVMLPWFLRNLTVFGSPLTPGGSRALWWTKYDDLFAFPAEALTPARWWAAGLGAILADRLQAAWLNAQSTLAVAGLVFLLPLIVWGLWSLRANPAVRAGVAGWALVFFVMTVVFPYAGPRGGYFHSAAVLQPLFWAVVPHGLDRFVDLGARRRGWRPAEARAVFGAGLVVIALAASGTLAWVRVISPAQQAGTAAYLEAEALLAAGGAEADAIVMVNNPPGYFRLTGRPAIVIPDGGLPAILAAAGEYGAAYLVLGEEQGLPEVFETAQPPAGLRAVGAAAGLRVFAFERAP